MAMASLLGNDFGIPLEFCFTTQNEEGTSFGFGDWNGHILSVKLHKNCLERNFSLAPEYFLRPAAARSKVNERGVKKRKKKLNTVVVEDTACT